MAGLTVTAPGSKSVAQRALMMAALANSPTVLRGVTYCDDVLACARLISALGAKVDFSSECVTVRPRVGRRLPSVDVGESATALRMGAALVGLNPIPMLLEMKGTLAHRNHQDMVSTLRKFGVAATVLDDVMEVRGPIKQRSQNITDPTTSQPISGLMLALSQISGHSKIVLDHPVSVPYLHLTAQVAKQFGVEISVADTGQVIEVSGPQIPQGTEFVIPGDWSCAAFWLVAGTFTDTPKTQPVTVRNLNLNSLQADRLIVTALHLARAKVETHSDSVTVTPSPLQGFDIDAHNAPDCIPPLVALATACTGESRIKGAHRLWGKESNRAETLQTELTKLGVNIKVADDVITVTGTNIQPGAVNVHNDHRIAMTTAILGLRCNNRIQIDNPAAVQKSYPDFFAELSRMWQ